MKNISILSALLAISISVLVNAATINIPDDYSTIQAGVNASTAGDTILVDAGTYTENVLISSKAIVLIGDTLDNSTTIIDGDSSGAVVTFNSGVGSSAAIMGFTIQNGYHQDGGGILCGTSSPTISKNTIIDNYAETGGGISCWGSGSLTIVDNVIRGNTAKVGLDGGGGGIYCNRSTVVVTGNVIDSNFAEDYGGGIYLYIDSMSDISDNTIADNTSGSSGGGIHSWTSDSLSITDNSITDNTSWVGGGITVHSSTKVTVDSNTISNNTAQRAVNAAGGGISCSSTSPTISNNTIVDNNGNGISCALSSPDITGNVICGNDCNSYGGGISCVNNSFPDITNNTISDNTASTYGGGLVFITSSAATVVNTIFWGNSAGTSGDDVDVFVTAGTPSFDYCDIGDTTDLSTYFGTGVITADPQFCDTASDDYTIRTTSPCVDAGQSGVDIGALGVGCNGAWIVDDDGTIGVDCDFNVIQNGINASIDGDTVLVRAGTYTENINYNGKDILVLGDTVTNSTTVIDGNSSGTVVTFSTSETSSAVIAGFTIQNGNNTNGGGIYCSGSSPTIHKNTISDNYAYDGGGIYCVSNSSPTISYNTISSDSVGHHGGGIYFKDNSDPTIANNTITDNYAYQGGAAYCRDTCSSTFTDNTISGNQAFQMMGGIAFTVMCTSTISGNTISDNSSYFYGGGIYSYGSTLTIRDNTISGNSIGEYGGGIYATTNSSLTIIDNTIRGNTADYNSSKGRGGGIACFNSAVFADSNVIDSNHAHFDGGGIHLNNDTASTISNNTISDNTCNSNGGGVYSTGSDSASITNNTITANSALRGAGVGFGGSSTAILSNNGITNNTTKVSASSEGGGVYCNGSSPVISDNSLIGNAAGQYGGGISCKNGSPVISGNVICKNYLDAYYGYGGGISLVNSMPDIDGNVIYDNVVDGYYSYGGGLYFQSASASDVVNSIIWGNSAGTDGNDIYLDGAAGTPSFAYCDIDDTTDVSTYFGTGVITADPQFCDTANDEYTTRTTSPCVDAGEGGVDIGALGVGCNGVWVVDDDGTIGVDCDFNVIQNGIDATVDGDTVRVLSGTYVENIDFSGNDIKVIGDTVDNSTTVIDGDSTDVVVTFSNGETSSAELMGFTIQNGSSNNGGGIYCHTTSPVIRKNTISGNYGRSGAAICCWYSSATVNDNTISGNNAIWHGGGVYCLVSTLSVSDNTISGNTAGEAGGGVYFWQNSTVTITNNTIRGNSADNGIQGNGGGIFGHASTATVDSNVVDSNYAHSSGGGIYLGIDSSSVISNNTISDNTGNYGGGGIYSTGSDSLSITNNTITLNTGLSGGGIALRNGSSGTTSDNTISSCSTSTTAGYGGGIYCNGSSPTIADNTLIGNYANKSGGGIYCYSSSPDIEGNVICKNDVDNNNGYGGGISLHNNSAPDITNNTLSDNYAKKYGGGIYFESSSSSTVLNTIVWGNDANHGEDVRVDNSAGTPSFDYCDVGDTADISDYIGTGVISADPDYCDTANDDYSISSTSPCDGAGQSGADIGALGVGCTGSPRAGVSDDPALLPGVFSLDQNYPNPFNPSTTINFALPIAAQVKLEIFNIVGQRVTTVIDGQMDAGIHQVTWGSGNHASGIYLYRLSAGSFIETKKMILLK
ncbi:MAG: right-handed parallel beta-helix repeat-containing protein [candidate division Zixibacteria bacterium]|nr:right-handed parallel beta-helix repeat-containing protein [candidate division Zixibacteria bacterium]MDH3935929.1 right-handed parallel beta-helix repeat-containing protein [candidate division Zixibacteria bacterium]MDH4032943.1 right-handed parallel beta-helix repeat-containing protein [candidate division Zixibacteria bacterium]